MIKEGRTVYCCTGFDMQNTPETAEKKGSKREKRINDRKLVFRLLFAHEFQPDIVPSRFYLKEIETWEETPGEGVMEKYLGVFEHLEEIDSLLSSYAEKWSLNRIAPATRSILRLSVYEMLWGKIPPAISINEAVEIAKEYDTESSQRFINGILMRIAREKGIISGTNESDPSKKE